MRDNNLLSDLRGGGWWVGVSRVGKCLTLSESWPWLAMARLGWCQLSSHHFLAWQLLTRILQKTKQPIMPSYSTQSPALLCAYRDTDTHIIISLKLHSSFKFQMWKCSLTILSLSEDTSPLTSLEKFLNIHFFAQTPNLCQKRTTREPRYCLLQSLTRAEFSNVYCID